LSLRAWFTIYSGIFLWSAACLNAQPASNERVAGGPFVVNVGQRSATLVWIVESTQVSVHADDGKPDRNIPVLRVEKTELTGLRPATVYHYQAFPGEAGKGSFKTAPSGAAKFQFVVYGDTRTRHDVHRAVIAGVVKFANPDFVMHTGDLVENGADSSLWPIFFDAEHELLNRAAFFPSLGNHEHHAQKFFDFTDSKPYYSFNWGSAHFTVLDTDIGTAGATQAERDAYWSAETRWLEDDLAASQKAEFRFVFGHHPPMTAVKRRQGDNPHVTALEPMLEKYHVNAAFFGHDHNYQHYLNNGIHYFVTGGGGAPLYDVDSPPAGITKKVVSTENFLIVDVDNGNIRIEAKKPDGETIDTATIAK